MTATVRRRIAADFLDQATKLGHEWLAVGVSTAPADREAAEHILTRTYTRHRRARPHFEWVESPWQALPLTAGIPSHEDLQSRLRPRPGRAAPTGNPDHADRLSRPDVASVAGVAGDAGRLSRPDVASVAGVAGDAGRLSRPDVASVAGVAGHAGRLSRPDVASVAGVAGHAGRRRQMQTVGRPPLASDIAATWSRMMAGLDEGATHPDLDTPKPTRKRDKPWPILPPTQALEFGVPLRLVLRQTIRDALRTILMDSIALPVRATLGPTAKTPICWYGQQDAYWIAHYDILRRLGLAHYPPPQAAALDAWATLARSTGWWWPGEQVCVMVDRPAHIGPVTLPGDALPVRTDPPIRYRDAQPHPTVP